MKKLSVLVSILAIGLMMAVVAPSAEANCIPGKIGGNADYPLYAYIDFADASGDNSSLIGQFWVPNDPGIRNDPAGTVPGYAGPVQQWAFGVPGVTYYWYFYVDLGSANFTGCPLPGASLTVYLENTATDKFVLWTADEFAQGGNLNWLFRPSQGFAAAGDSPRPTVNSSARNGTSVDMNVTVADPSAGHWQQSTAGGITGVNLYAKPSADAPDPNDLNGWAMVGSVTATGGTTDVSVDCTDTNTSQWLAAGIMVDSQDPQVFSESIQVECDPNLADPGDNFKVVRPAPEKKRIKRDN